MRGGAALYPTATAITVYMLFNEGWSPADGDAAVALGERDGPRAGLVALEQVRGLEGPAVLHAARAELLLRAGQTVQARAAYDVALGLPLSGPHRAQRLRRRTGLAADTRPATG